ncbi:hypothetical protein IP69_13640 [Bosea sp. AAP35]|nr:hypothetical protein IP69_13640 [Bosea sp. AAP35]
MSRAPSWIELRAGVLGQFCGFGEQVAVELADAVAHEAFRFDALEVDAKGATILVELLPARAGVEIVDVITGHQIRD